MRKSRGEELKAAGGEIVSAVFDALKESGVSLDLDQQLAVVSRVRDVIDRVGANGTGSDQRRGGDK